MIHHGVYPDVYTYSILVDALCKEGRAEDAKGIVESMIQKDIGPNVVTYNALIDGYCLQGRIHEAKQVFDSMLQRGVQPDTASYITLINGYCKRREMEEAINLVREMSLQQLKPDIVTYTTVLQGLFRARRFPDAQKMNGHVEEALVFLQELERKNVDLSCSMYDIVVAGLCKKGKLSIAQDIFNKVRSDGLHVKFAELSTIFFSSVPLCIFLPLLSSPPRHLMFRNKRNGTLDSLNGYKPLVLLGYVKLDGKHKLEWRNNRNQLFVPAA
ncbi:hypothetical protein K7X08_008210 [Anisodus acutangulus]|uniref:Pentatricopeptide repeat-containing protein n=1 Tax=Anisodus acutangulus TaxID=402998 RepID=A0A9Q1MQ00_9SOLA|nr:hypothetical protein K7X08_008210 [Anisodus acutangulus]